MMYIYGIKELPKIPEWNKDTNPYAVISISIEKCVLTISPEPFSYYAHNSANIGVVVPKDTSYMYAEIVSDWGDYSSSNWGDFETAVAKDPVGPLGPLDYLMAFWSNHDILNPDGTVYLAASEPIPLGEFTITKYDPASTDFSAVGWVRVCYHKNEDSWVLDDLRNTPSTGWNYLKNIRYCTRDKLYHQGVEVWPTLSGTWSYNGIVYPALPEWNKVKYPHVLLSGTPVADYPDDPSGLLGYLFCSTNPIYYEDDASLFKNYIVKEYTEIICFVYDLTSSDANKNWIRYPDKDKNAVANETAFTDSLGKIRYSNYDVLNHSDNSIHHAASVPIPYT